MTGVNTWDPWLQLILLEVASWHEPNLVFADLGLGLRLVKCELVVTAMLGAGVSGTYSRLMGGGPS